MPVGLPGVAISCGLTFVSRFVETMFRAADVR